MPEFKIVSKFKPTGDQPKAIDSLVKSIENGDKRANTFRGNWIRKNLYHG